jgi:GT2 family glycosyltransferase
LLRFAQTLNENPTCKLIYSDEDKINSLGKRVDPYFKPDWNPDLLLSQNYICHLCCINVDLVREISGFRKGYEGCQDWDLFLRATELLNENEIFHIPEILYHWRKGGGSTASGAKAKEYVFENSIKTIESALDRRKIEAEVELSDESNNYIRIKYNISKIQPLVSIIIPTRDYLKYLRVCIEGILTGTSYENFEILILDNESKDKSTLDYFDQLSNDERIRIIKTPGKFNYSKINNLGVTYAKGELLLFLNNDIEPISDNWLTEMVSHGIRPEIGCVGAKLLYPNDTIQHGGVVLGLGGLAGHAFKSFPMDHSGYKNRLCLVQNYSAVTAACLLVKKKLFEQVGGFNEENLQVAFNDVDFCLKVREQGFRNLWTPFALLYHFESASRGDDLSPKKLKRFNKEAEYMKKTWKNELSFDPAYNSNLTLDREDFSLGLPRSRN